MKRAFLFVLSALLAGAASAGDLEALRADCRQSALSGNDVVGDAFAACDLYHVARQSAADGVLAGLYMARINGRMQQIDARDLPSGGRLLPSMMKYSRPTRYAEESINAAAELRDETWVLPELARLLTSSSGMDVYTASRVFDKVRSSPMAEALSHGPEWAALKVAEAALGSSTDRGMKPAERQQRRRQLLSQFPEVQRQLAKIPDEEARRYLQLRALHGLSELQEDTDASAAFDSLETAWQQALSAPSELGFTQLLISNLIRDHGGLARDRNAALWQIIRESPNDQYKDRLVRALAAVEEDCAKVSMLSELAQKYGDRAEGEKPWAASNLAALTLYGDVNGMRRELRLMTCLSPQALREMDQEGALSNVLGVVSRYADKDRDLQRLLMQVDRRLKQK